MSLYRFARATALLALLRKYRQRLVWIVFAVAFALVADWAYPDLARYAEQQHPQALVWLLAIKTVILFSALFVVLWQLNRMIQGDDAQAQKITVTDQAASPAEPQQGPSPLDELLHKPKLRSRKQDLLDK